MSTKAKMKAQIVGSAFYPGANAVLMRLMPGSPLYLKRPPAPPYKDAIGVYRLTGQQLGLLPKGASERIGPIVDAGTIDIAVTKAPLNGAFVNIEWDEPAEVSQAEDDDELVKRFKALKA